MDNYFNLKASFESFVGIRDFESTKKIISYSSHLQFIEDNLPIPDKYKSKTIGQTGNSPILFLLIKKKKKNFKKKKIQKKKKISKKKKKKKSKNFF